MKKLFLSLLLISSIQAQNKIIYLIAHPRSFSTIFMRTFESREDTSIYCEPSTPPHCIQNNITPKGFVRPAHIFQTFKEVKKTIFTSLETKHVLVKAMSFMDYEFLIKDKDFISNPNIYFFFLIRNPHHSTISFYNKLTNFEFPFVSSWWVGYEASYKLLQEIKKYSAHQPKIIIAEDFIQHPEETLKSVCKHVGIDYKETMLSFKNLNDDIDPKTLWGGQKAKRVLDVWHTEAIHSTGITQPKKYDTNENGQPTFIEVDSEKRDQCRQYYAENLPYYHLLMNETEYRVLA